MADIRPETWILAGLLGAILAAVRGSRPGVKVNLDRALLRSGLRTLQFDEIDRAWLDDHDGEKSLRFGTTALKLAATVSGTSGRVIGPTTRAVLVRMISESCIELPQDRFDPTGRYLRTTYAKNLTKDEALVLLRDR